MKRLAWLFLGAAWFTAEANAQLMFEIVPPQPTTRDYVFVRMHGHVQCGLDDWDVQVFPALRTLRHRVVGDDTCPERDYDTLIPVGYLGAGDWRLESWGCEHNLLAQPDIYCGPNDRPPVLFAVTWAGKARLVPAWSAAGAAVLCALLLVLASRRLRPR